MFIAEEKNIEQHLNGLNILKFYSKLFYFRSYSPLSPSSQPMSPDVIESPRSGSPIDIPQIDLMNEMEDLLQLRLETPPVDRSVSRLAESISLYSC